MPNYRPLYHLSPPTGWLNDPNGLIYHAGEYHLFYQWCEFVNVDTSFMCWAHAVSKDLVHWEELPLSLEHDELGSIYSGSAVFDARNTSGLFGKDGGLVAIFTHHSRQDAERQSIAFSSDRGRTWTKYAKNPVLGDDRCRDFRDPKVFWHEPTQRWVMIVGVEQQLYSSENLRDWKKLGLTKFKSECPDLFPVPLEGRSGSKWVLSLGGRQYCVGDFDGKAFTPESAAEEVDGGPDFYATQSWDDVPDGRRIWIGWINNWEYCRKVPEFGARGYMSIPRDMTLRQIDGKWKLIQLPCPELTGLRKQKIDVDCSGLKSGKRLFSSESFELEATLAPAGGDRCGLKIRSSPAQEMTVGYDASASAAFIERQRSSTGLTNGRFKLPLPVRNGRVTLRIFVDKSSIEAFFNDGEAVITTQFYPDDNSTGIDWYSESGKSGIEKAAVWTLGV